MLCLITTPTSAATRVTLEFRSNTQQPSTHLAVGNIFATTWFPNTGVNQHVTPDLGTLTNSAPYLGTCSPSLDSYVLRSATVEQLGSTAKQPNSTAASPSSAILTSPSIASPAGLQLCVDLSSYPFQHLLVTSHTSPCPAARQHLMVLHPRQPKTTLSTATTTSSVAFFKQALRAWYTHLNDFLLSIGFYASKVDTSLFIFSVGADICYLLVYVDDILLTGSNSLLLQRLIQLLSSKFKLCNLGSVIIFWTPISWKSGKQCIVAHSSTKAEYKALADGTAKVIWLQYLLTDLQIPSASTPII
ncbi:uncharacterized protein [Populus alba]|uniref:uncharacterized protein n=1 Tax=Populus alba TaxID=43335 RepID=UPI003CC71756